MHPRETFTAAGWGHKAGKRGRRLKYSNWALRVVLLVFVLIGLLWFYLQLLVCQMDAPLAICKYAVGVPLILGASILILFGISLWDLWDYGVESQVKERLEHFPEPVEDDELRDVVDAYLGIDDDNLKKRLRKHKVKEGVKIWNLRRHSRSGYNQLDETSRWYFQITGILTAIAFGILVGTFVFFYANVPAFAALLSAVAAGAASWFLSLRGVDNEPAAIRNERRPS